MRAKQIARIRNSTYGGKPITKGDTLTYRDRPPADVYGVPFADDFGIGRDREQEAVDCQVDAIGAATDIKFAE